jgi:tetratricopeptide (TPR) repeat protein
LVVVSLIAAGCAAGCAADGTTKANLEAGFAALESKQFDEAIGRADEQLARTPRGPVSAEALYLKGRAIEQRVKPDNAAARADLEQARHHYLDALQQAPPRPLDAYIKTSLANIDYAQDDYASALRGWSAVYPELENDDVKSWVHYRIGLCQQRLGQFAAADRTYAAVLESYPNTIPAQRARQHMGKHSFAVQLTRPLTDPKAAERVMQQARREGAMPTRLVDPNGNHIVTVGPTSTYAQALQLKARFAGSYPDAMIVP